MSQRLYIRLAWTGIQKNRQLYYPYLLSGMTMIMVYYIFAFLAASDLVYSLRGGPAMTTMLVLGEGLVGFFSVPFLFYTSSALMKKRKKEFGLYNILGMNKRNILMILSWETLLSYGIVAVAGCILGITFSKIAELGLLRVMQEEVGYRIYVEWKAVVSAFMLYAGIYFLIFLNMMRQIQHNNPIELLQSAAAGERPPKNRRLLAAVGVGILGAGYVLLASVSDNQQAIARMYVAAPLMVAGTYLLFIAGSVALCRLLQKNRQYYYKPSHFVTVSSLTYRMKRNGASLASICILSTAILVALAMTFGFYSGADSVIERHYPYELGVMLEAPRGMENQREIYGAGCRPEIERLLKGAGVKTEEALEVYAAGLSVPLEDGVLDLSFDLVGESPEEGNVAAWEQYLEKFICVRVMGLEDYNRIAHVQEELGEGEVLIAGVDAEKKVQSVKSWDERKYTVKKAVEEQPRLSAFTLYNSFLDTMRVKSLLLVVPNMEQFWENYDASLWESRNQIRFFWEYDAQLEGDRDAKLAVGDELERWAQGLTESETGENVEDVYYVRTEKYAKLKGLAGGVLFLAILVSGVFVFVTTLILYYKQLSEGYEDQKQFAIMRKIGMTKREIRRSVNSQMFTVFCFPLLAAGVHLAFVMPSIYQLTKYAVVDDLSLLIRVAAIGFLLFAAVYTLVYMMAARVYFQIVNRSADW